MKIAVQYAFSGMAHIGLDKKKSINVHQRIKEFAYERYGSNGDLAFMYQNLISLVVQVFGSLRTEDNIHKGFAEHLSSNKLTKFPGIFDDNTIKALNSPELYDDILGVRQLVHDTLKEREEIFQIGIEKEELTKLFIVLRSQIQNYDPEMNSGQILFPTISPFMNLVNHSFEPNCKFEHSFQRSFDDTMTYLTPIKDIQPGEELTVNYGNMSNIFTNCLDNHKLVARQGFIVTESPFSQIEMDLEVEALNPSFFDLVNLKKKILRSFSKDSFDSFTLQNNKFDDVLHPFRVIAYLDQSPLTLDIGLIFKPRIDSFQTRNRFFQDRRFQKRNLP